MSDPVKIYTNGHTVETGHPLPVSLDSTAVFPLAKGASSTDSDDKLNLIIRLLLQKASECPPWLDIITNALNTKLVSGSTTAVTGSLTSAGTVSTVSTVTTLSDQTNIGGYSANLMTVNASETDWGITTRMLLI